MDHGEWNVLSWSLQWVILKRAKVTFLRITTGIRKLKTWIFQCDNFVATVNAIPHYNDVIMGAMASQITSLTIVYLTVHSGTDQRKHQSSASLTFMRGIHRWPVNSPHKWPVTRKIFPFDDVIMGCQVLCFNTWRQPGIRMFIIPFKHISPIIFSASN